MTISRNDDCCGVWVPAFAGTTNERVATSSPALSLVFFKLRRN